MTEKEIMINRLAYSMNDITRCLYNLRKVNYFLKYPEHETRLEDIKENILKEIETLK